MHSYTGLGLTRQSPCSCKNKPVYLASPSHDLFTRQTGQLLIEFGFLFLNFPPFNEHVNKHTAFLLISIGRKLNSKK